MCDVYYPCFWLTSLPGELRTAARTLFDAGVAGLTAEETISLVERWQHSCNVLSLQRLVFGLMSGDIQCRSYFQTLKDGHLSPRRLCYSVGLLPLVNISYSLQGGVRLFTIFESDLIVLS